MGHTHYWEKPAEIAPEVFRAIVADFSQLIPHLEQQGVVLRDGWGEDEPVLLDEVVCFNGPADCGCGRRWLEFACGSCGCGQDSFFFPRVEDPEYPSWFCKTNGHHYDLAVMAFLVIAGRHLGDRLRVRSQGSQAAWDLARNLCDEVREVVLSC